MVIDVMYRWLCDVMLMLLYIHYVITRRRPDDVVPKHHRRAVALWMLLIIGILACESVLIFRLVYTGTRYELHSFDVTGTIFRCPASITESPATSNTP